MPMYDLIEYSNSYSKISEMYGTTVEMNQLYMLITLSLIFLLVIIAAFRLNLKENLRNFQKLK